MAFIKRVDECMGANNWMDQVTCNIFYLALQVRSGPTLLSPSETSPMHKKTWITFKPMFKQEFATLTEDKLIVDGPANYAMRPNKQYRNYMGRLEEIMDMLDESDDLYQVMLHRPQDHAARGLYNNNTMMAYVN
jgi:hypothetical protein